MDNSSEKLGQAIDRVENMLFALQMPLPPTMHVEQFKASLPEIVEELKAGFVEVVGENPWE
jgi:hypothetical protein